MEHYRFSAGDTPLIVSMPHVGLDVPEGIARRMTAAALTLPDTDWNVDRLYDFTADLGGVMKATHTRYVVDLNRAPDDRALYADAVNTGLCPTSRFDGGPIYLPGQGPDEAEMALRREQHWHPYHDRLAAEIARLKERFGYALLFDAHSIRSREPRLFAGRLPDLNLGTAGGASADPALEARLADVCRGAPGLSHAVNGRFTGGYITRHYGRPAEGVHAVQLELAQVTYMDEDPPYGFDEARAATLRPVLLALIETMLDWRPAAKV